MNAIATLALLTPLALLPQGGRTKTKALSDTTIPSAAELVMHQYAPQNISSRELYQYAAQNLSRQFQVRDEVTGELSVHASIQTLGGRVLVYESPKSAQRLMETLKALDLPSATAQEAQAYEFLTEVYNPKHVPISQLYVALQPYKKQVSTGPGNAFQNVTAIDDLGQLVIRDTPSQVEEMLDFLKATDQPTKQVLLTAYMVTPTDEVESNSGLPSELVSGLAPMLGAKGLHKVAIGVVRTGVGSDRQVVLTLQAANSPPSQLEFAPSAFNANGNGGGSLTLRSCSLAIAGRIAFSTQTSVDVGEYVVLGATGSDPAYLVLHIKAL
ncbi:MAG: hypothetical protein ACI8QC_001357 [Planctomycetota bacterium]|jgi:hypothetical protein